MRPFVVIVDVEIRNCGMTGRCAAIGRMMVGPRCGRKIYAKQNCLFRRETNPQTMESSDRENLTTEMCQWRRLPGVPPIGIDQQPGRRDAGQMFDQR